MLEWRGWRLLFAGDAEKASWIMMEKQKPKRPLRPVHFLKTAHHGSVNGTPDDSILEEVLPASPHDSRVHRAVHSTCPGTSWVDVPHDPTLDRLQKRCDLVRSMTEVKRGEVVVLPFMDRLRSDLTLHRAS